MSEIFSWRTCCRCCHKSAGLESPRLPYECENNVEMYSTLLLETFNITIKPPQYEASYAICDHCIQKLREATAFKHHVIECELKFEEYCRNEELRLKEAELAETSNNNCDTIGVLGPCRRDSLQMYLCDTPDTDHPVCQQTNIINNLGGFTFHIEPKIEVLEEGDEHMFERDDNVAVEASEIVRQMEGVDTIERQYEVSNEVTEPHDAMLEIHLKTNRGEFYKCKICRKKYKLIATLRRHINYSHHAFKCTFCLKILSTRQEYLKHVRLESRTCKICSVSFSRKTKLLEHKKTHVTKEYTCIVCDISFRLKREYAEHKMQHRWVKRKATCDICGREFINKYNLSDHIKAVHQNLRPYKCTLCPKTFKVRKDLRDHVRLHTGEKPYNCNQCAESFSCLWKLRQHRGKHDGFKFKCSMCERSFPSNYSLNQHVNRHNGVRPNACDQCDKTYVTVQHLNRHKLRAHGPKSKMKNGAPSA